MPFISNNIANTIDVVSLDYSILHNDVQFNSIQLTLVRFET